MSTQIFFGKTVVTDWATGNNNANLAGTAQGWKVFNLRTTRDSGLTTSGNVNTVTGATNGVEAPAFGSFISDPLDADVTISGSITWNLWAEESNMSANVAINAILEVVDGATGTITLIDKTTRVTEVAIGTGARAVNNFAETPPAGVACHRGDRLRVRVFGDDAGTMASGFTFDWSWAGNTAAADGDSFFTLTETLTFVSEPAGTQVFLTDTASDVSTASVDREAWTSRGAGVQTDVTNTVADWTAPIQMTDTAGGTVVDWFTRPLQAFTLGGAARCNIRASGSTSNFAAVRVEIAIVAGDGTGATTWAASSTGSSATGSETAFSFLVAGADTAVSAGQRLRIRLLIDDYISSVSFQGNPMVTGQTVTLAYAGTSGGASGDTFVTFTQTLTEQVADVPKGRSPYPQLLAH